MSNQVPFYLWKRLDGEREHDRFGDRIVCADINGDGFDEWIISASTATQIEDEGGVNPIPYYYKGRIYVYSHDLQLLFTLDGENNGDCFGASLAVGDVDGDGMIEIIVGAPRANFGPWIQCGTISVFSGVTGKVLYMWGGIEDYARLGTAMAILDWNGDGIQDVAASSHITDPNGTELSGNVMIYTFANRSLLKRFDGVGKEGLGLSLAAGDVNGDGNEEIIIGAPRSSNSGLTRNGRVLVYAKEKGMIYESTGKRNFDEFGLQLAVGDMDGDGTNDLIIGSPKASLKESRCGLITVYSFRRNKVIFKKEGWFGLQELGTSIMPYADQAGGSRKILAGSKIGATYLMDMNGKLIHEFNGYEPEVFGHSLAIGRGEAGQWVAIGAIAAMNQKKFMAGCVYFMSPLPSAAPQRIEPSSLSRTQNSAKPIDSKRKRILLATYWYLPHVGGVDVYVRVLKKELERAGHHVDILAHHPDMVHYYLVDGHKKIEKWQIKRVIYEKLYRFYQRFMSHVDPWIRYRDIERYCFEVAATLFDLEQYDVIHTQDIVSTRALSRVKPPSVALVATIHGLLAKEHLISGDIKSKESLAWKYVSDEEYYGCVSADVTIVPTDWLRHEMEQFAVPPESLTVFPYGMDVAAFEEKTKLPLSSPVEKKGIFTISCPARLVPVKGHSTLLGGLRKLASDTSWHCWLIGDGQLRREIKQMISDYGLTERITMLGDRNDVPALLKRSDIMVLPSLQDNLPFSIMEAQLAGTPIVASNAGGIPEMIEHGHTGLLFDVGNEEQLAQQLARLLKDAELRSELAGNAKEWAESQWSSVTLMERTLSVYDKALMKVRT